MSTFSAETHAGVQTYDLGRFIAGSLTHILGGDPMPRLQENLLTRPQSVKLPVQMFQFSDCQSLVDHLLGEKQTGVSELRLWGYIRVLQEALMYEDIERIFHIGGPWNPVDPLTKLIDGSTLHAWMTSGVLHTAPGKYSKGRCWWRFHRNSSLYKSNIRRNF